MVLPVAAVVLDVVLPVAVVTDVVVEPPPPAPVPVPTLEHEVPAMQLVPQRT